MTSHSLFSWDLVAKLAQKYDLLIEISFCVEKLVIVTPQRLSMTRVSSQKTREKMMNRFNDAASFVFVISPS